MKDDVKIGDENYRGSIQEQLNEIEPDIAEIKSLVEDVIRQNEKILELLQKQSSPA